MDLNTLWFILIGVLFAGFFVLEGFDYGAGILLPFLGDNDRNRRLIINTIGPVWDGNEVWMLTAGGAIFAAFPNWYATLFSGFYLALVILLFSLIVRGVAFEFRSQLASPRWRSTWDWLIFLGGFLPALLWGVAVSNLMQGVPIDAKMNFTGSLFTLLNPFSLLGGVVFVLLFTLHGAWYLNLRTPAPVRERSETLAKKLWLPTLIAAALWIVWSYFTTGTHKPAALSIALLTALTLIAVRFQFRTGRAFMVTSLTIIFAVVMVFAGLYPNVMPSTTDPALSLTIYNASSSPYTLQIMTIVAAIFVPIVLAYQAWAHWVFRHRVSPEDLEY